MYKSPQKAVKLLRGELVIQTHSPDRSDVTEAMLEGWYREKAHLLFANRIEVNLGRFPESERFRPTAVIVRELRQRWGSLSPGGKLLLNRRLIEAPVIT